MKRSAAPLLYERSHPGRRAADLPPLDVPALDNLIDAELLGEALPLPEVSEVELVRHYTLLSRRNFGVDNGSYPLGSCTMKYNPKINEELPGMFARLHPLMDETDLSSVWELMADLDAALCEITGMDRFTLQPAAGAHGELTGLMLIKAYHDMRQDFARTEMLIPDAAHGTNPASAALAGFKTIELASTPDGDVDLARLREAVNERTAGLMLTNPSTLGLFERNIKEIAAIVHEAGGLLYYDGANANAIMGIARPGDMGFDVVHLNLHKTFGTPHGGGGPGAGPVGVKKELIPFLPAPVILRQHGGPALPDYARPLSIGRVKSFYGNFGVLVKAYAYILSLGGSGLKEASENAVLNANYVQHFLKDDFGLPHARICMHECVLTPGPLMEYGIHTTDIAKALIDHGFHPPTIYFPLIVPEAMMFEPTETESREDLDKLIAAMKEIAALARTNPDALHQAPRTTPVGRPDETRAARTPVVRYTPNSAE
ncbi:aminomethyl-transferring glycine dehydrogenase subunit GcvPB [Christensenellaceae bacterium OttesenSCG-928-L17]|nr:aminomethyl-transferring glycine dehydrogenase subunit GcvPB [Christensenellaceae bacterium OttesenSCG-928-L17]